MIIAGQINSEPVVVLLTVAVVFYVGRLIAERTAEAEGEPWLRTIMIASLVFRLICTPAIIFVTQHVYHSVADWSRYTHQGVALAPGFRHFDFSLAPGHLGKIVNDGALSIVTGAVMAVVGANLMATFFVFSLGAFVGTTLFYRAFTLTFPRADHKRYALLLFLFPSLMYWTSDVSKESAMLLALGLTSYGVAKFLARAKGGVVLVVPGAVLGIYIRPNEMALLLAGTAAAMMVPAGSIERARGGFKRIVGTVFLGAILAVAIVVTVKYLHTQGTQALNNVNAANATATSVSGSSAVSYSSSPAAFPKDVFTVLADPLPFNAHGSAQYAAAMENLVLLGVIIASYRQLRMVLRAAVARPYVMLCLIYSLGFLYAFAALANLGLIERERVLLMPYLFVLLAIPRAPKGQPPRYEWEVPRSVRRRLRAAYEASRRRPGRLPSRT